MFVVAGPEPVRWMVERGFRVFLDLKFHDIPNTVAQACAAATRLGVWMLNVHAGGGRAMLAAARDAVDADRGASADRAPPLLIAVTVLTSLRDADLRAIGHRGRRRATGAAPRASDARTAASTASCARRTKRRRCVPRSGRRSSSSRRASGPPARRATTSRASITPQAAIANGADYLVIGRPITQAADPVAALAAINASLSESPHEDHDDRDGLCRPRHRRLPRRGRQRRPRASTSTRARSRSSTTGGVPIHEPGLEPMIARNVAAGRLRFTTDVDAAVAHGALQFIAVGTPPDEDGCADMKYVLAAARNIGRRMTEYKIVVDKSTVPVGTADRVREAIARGARASAAWPTPFAVVSNPEFLKEGAAVEDFMRPDRIVIGADDERAIAAMRAVYAPFQRNHERLLRDGRALGRAHQVRGQRDAGDAHLVHERARQPRRRARRRHRARPPGHRLRSADRLPLPVSGRGLRRLLLPEGRQGAAAHGAPSSARPLKMLGAVEDGRTRRRSTCWSRRSSRASARTSPGRRFAMWGLAFKPNTDDMREAPSLVIIAALAARGARDRRVRPGRDGRGAPRVRQCAARLASPRRRWRPATAPMRSSSSPSGRNSAVRTSDALAQDAQGAAAVRRPQPLRPCAGARRRPRILLDRPPREPTPRRTHRVRVSRHGASASPQRACWSSAT